MHTEPIGSLTVAEFCSTYNVGRTFLYEEVRAGRLTACKAGSKTLIMRVDAEQWAASLPRLKTARAI